MSDDVSLLTAALLFAWGLFASILAWFFMHQANTYRKWWKEAMAMAEKLWEDE